MTTKRRIEASRANGAKSKGPITPEGKRASSTNNLRHGLLARTVVLDAENRELFYRLLKDFETEFNPQGPVQAALVQNLAVARWRQMRIWSMEKAALDYQIGKQDEAVNAPTKAALAFRTLTDQSRSLELNGRYEARCDRQFGRTLARLTALQLRRNEIFHSNLVPNSDNLDIRVDHRPRPVPILNKSLPPVAETPP